MKDEILNDTIIDGITKATIRKQINWKIILMLYMKVKLNM